jgi:Condensation domain
MTAPAALADRIRLEAALLARRRGRTDSIPRLPRGTGTTTFPVSAIQRLMWELHHEYPGETTFITLGGIWLRGPLDRDALQRAFDGLVERHEACRTLFRHGPDGELVQDVHAGVRHPIVQVDVTVDGVDDAAAAAIDEPFDLVRGPLVRMHLLRVNPMLHQVMLVLHHIVSDGVTMEIFVQELAASYLALAAGVPAPLPPLTVQPADVAAWQNARLRGPLGARQTAYWRERLAGFVPAELPTDAQRRPVPSSAGLTYQLAVPPALVAELGRLAAQRQVTLFMLTLAAFHVLMGWYTGRPDTGVATPFSYRTRSDLAGPVGAFINYLVLRADLSGDPTFAEVLERVRQSTVTDFEHHDLPLDDVIDALGMDPEHGRYALLRTLFTEESDPAVPLEADGGIGAELVLEPPWHHALRDFTVRVTAGSAGTHIIATYRVDAFTPARVADIAADYLDLLTAVVADPHLRILDAASRPALRLRVPAATHSDPAQEDL